MKVEHLREAGFSDTEISDWAENKRRELSDAGFSDGEISSWLGTPPFDMKPITDHIQTNLQMWADHEKTTAPEGPEQVRTFRDAVEAGIQISVSGLMKREDLPSKVLAPDAPWASRIASHTATLAGFGVTN